MQDAAAALPARLLAPKPGERIADLCAAPGGKTAQLAAAGAEVLAVDRSAKRLKRLEENLARLKLAAATRAIDAEQLDEAPFDAILLDAPCSATGTIRRHPDVAWTKGEDVKKLAGLQARLLDKAAGLLKPGPGGSSTAPARWRRKKASARRRKPSWRAIRTSSAGRSRPRRSRASRSA